MSISRTSIPFQVSKPPEEKSNVFGKKEKTRRLRKKGESSVQGVAQRRKVGAANWGESSKKRKRPVKKKLANGGFIAHGCGSVQEGRRKETNSY